MMWCSLTAMWCDIVRWYVDQESIVHFKAALRSAGLSRARHTMITENVEFFQKRVKEIEQQQHQSGDKGQGLDYLDLLPEAPTTKPVALASKGSPAASSSEKQGGAIFERYCLLLRN